jgi:hypothetical protein
LTLVLGCGDSSGVPSAPTRPIEPEPREQEPGEVGPVVIEAPCDEAYGDEERIYFFAEARAPEWEFEAFVCRDNEKPFELPVCSPTIDYVIQDGVISVLCGEWREGAIDLDYLGEFFVRLVEMLGEPGGAGGGGDGGDV